MSAASPSVPVVRLDPPVDLGSRIEALRETCSRWPETVAGQPAHAPDAHALAAHLCDVVAGQDYSWVQPLALGLIGGAMLAGGAYAAFRIVDGLIVLVGRGGRRLVRHLRERRAT